VFYRANLCECSTILSSLRADEIPYQGSADQSIRIERGGEGDGFEGSPPGSRHSKDITRQAAGGWRALACDGLSRRPVNANRYIQKRGPRMGNCVKKQWDPYEPRKRPKSHPKSGAEDAAPSVKIKESNAGCHTEEGQDRSKSPETQARVLKDEEVRGGARQLDKQRPSHATKSHRRKKGPQDSPTSADSHRVERFGRESIDRLYITVQSIAERSG